MVSIDDIPAKVRWEIATKAANSQSVAFDMLVRQIIGDKIDEIWNAIMMEGGKESMALAISLGLPASNAVEIDNTLSVIPAIILGPELKGEVLESNDNLVIGRTNDCPMLNAHRNIRYEPTTGTPPHCQAFCQSAVESLNPMYKMRYTKRMCTGDPHCEYIIELMK